MPSIELIFAEFGESRANAGDASLPIARLEPSLSSFKKHFPEATVAVYTDQPWEDTDDYTVRRVDSPFAKHPREGNRLNDYFQVIGLLDSYADVALAIDSDLMIVSKDVQAIVPLTINFGLCMPVNGRHLVWRDARSTCDGGPVNDPSLGMGMCHATALWAFSANNRTPSHTKLLEAYLEQIRDDAKANRGARGPLSLWRAEWKMCVSPYTLPVQWCVTGSNLGDSMAGNRTVPVILHVGHDAVRAHYADLIAANQ